VRRVGALTLMLLAGVSSARAEESFDPSAYEKKAFEWTGFVEVRRERQWLRQDSAGHVLQYPGETRRNANRLGGAAELSGVLRHRSLSFNFTGHASWLDEPRGSDERLVRSYEAYASWQVDVGSNVQLGKRALRWGKGYAWSPVAFLERPKDPDRPGTCARGLRDGHRGVGAQLRGTGEGPCR
jgi:hypothetical protein